MNYYNEFDPKAAAWLRELIKEGHIPAGDVDERDIRLVEPSDLKPYVQCHFFAGIGGWPLALRQAGWPENRPVWTGSCPCQPFSAAGKGLGEADERHLWPSFRWLTQECNPPVVFGEQVASKAGRQWLSGVRADLEALGYGLGAADLCAAGVGAPHIRQRLYWVGHSECTERGQIHSPCGNERWDMLLQREKSADKLGSTVADGRMANTQDANGRRGECGEETGTGPDGQRRGRLAGGSTTSRMDDATSPRCDGQEQRPEGEARNQARVRLPDESGADGGLVDPLGERGCSRDGERGCSRDGERGHAADALAPGHVDWHRSQWINCRDSKLRRVPVEPGVFCILDGLYRRVADLRPEELYRAEKQTSFPLAKKVEGRVALLRGIGNAIVPELASQFIQAYLET